MKRFLSTRHGFFALAAVVSTSLWLVIEPEHKWVPLALGALYLVLSITFFLDERSR